MPNSNITQHSITSSVCDVCLSEIDERCVRTTQRRDVFYAIGFLFSYYQRIRDMVLYIELHASNTDSTLCVLVK